MLAPLKQAVGTELGKRIGRNTAQIFFLRTAGMGLLLLMHTILARQLGPRGYGVVSYALSVASFGALLATLGLHNGVTRFAAEYLDAERWEELKGVLIRSGQIVVACSLTGAIVGAAILLTSVLPHSIRQSILYAAFVLPLSAVGLWRSHAARSIGGISVAFVPEEVILPCLVIVVAVAWSVTEPVLAVSIYLGAAFVSVILGLTWLVRFLPRRTLVAKARYHTRRWLSVSLPMTIASITQLSLSRGDALLLGALSSMEETGRYIVISRIAILVTLALRIVDMTVAPMISAAFHGDRHEDLKTIFRLGLGMSLLGGLPFFLAGVFKPRFILQIFGEDYLGATDVLQVLFFGQAINAATGPIAVLLLMTGHERIYAKAIGVAAVFSIAAHVVVIPTWGGLGAAWVTTISTAILNAGLLAFGIRMIHRQGHKKANR